LIMMAAKQLTPSPVAVTPVPVLLRISGSRYEVRVAGCEQDV
jgi:hypothetical protein